FHNPFALPLPLPPSRHISRPSDRTFATEKYCELLMCFLGITYLDHAGTTLYAHSQLQRFYQDLADNVYGNPHSENLSSKLTHDTIENVRYRVLQHFNTSPEEYSVIFTSGSTAALKLVAESFQWTRAKPRNSRSCFCYLVDNHTSVVGMRGLATLNDALAMPVKPEEILERKDYPLTNSIALDEEEDCHINHLFCYPAQSNFSGTKYPLTWTKDIKLRNMYPSNRISGKWFVLLDAASFVSTSPLDLTSHQPDFIPISFYKIFGFPTGLGALLVRNESRHLLEKIYFGGGTAAAYLAGEDFYVPRETLAGRFEDGTISFLDIIALKHGFDTLERLTGGMENIMLHTFSLVHYTYIVLTGMQHANGAPVSHIYRDNEFESPDMQGPIINFNILDENGDIVGYSQVDRMASLYNIHLRTGCFCNTGSCQQHLGISNEDVRKNLQAGHICGDSMDLIDGLPTGSVRISFGYMSTFEDAQRFLRFIIDSFVKNPVCFDKTILSNLSGTEIMKERCGFWTENHTDKRKIEDQEVSQRERNSARIQILPNCHVSESQSKLNSYIHENHEELINSDCQSVTLTNIYLYPVKSCAAFEVKKWPIGKHGLLFDRTWMIVNQNGVCVSQKQEPRLCLIHPHIDLEQGIMTISAEGMDPIMVPLEEGDGKQFPFQACQSKVCGDRVEGLDCGEKVAAWISIFLGRQSRLVRQSSDFHRNVKKQYTEGQGLTQTHTLSLVNEAQYLLINRASINHLKEQIVNSSIQALKTEELIHRFRANLVISGKRPYEEDDWAEVVMDGTYFQVVGQCSRCQMICIDQVNGKRSNEPLQTLALCRDRKLFSTVPFGSVTSRCFLM
uniref:Molybdenum cofactor sulfurase n=1 Tax=Callorhinchus milii TaxID=7868 RepID=A0A4W3JJ23_CALMI